MEPPPHCNNPAIAVQYGGISLFFKAKACVLFAARAISNTVRKQGVIAITCERIARFPAAGGGKPWATPVPATGAGIGKQNPAAWLGRVAVRAVFLGAF